MPRESKSFCRICTGLCGVTITLDDDDQVIGIRGDKSHEMSLGYACIKGLQAPAIQNGPSRILRPLKRLADDSFIEIPLEQALDEIAEKMAAIIARDGVEAIATYKGTQNALHAVASPMLLSFAQAIGTPSIFSTMTIDQSAKWVTLERMGRWLAGKHQFSTADVILFFGTNPLVSIMGINSFPALNPTKRMKEAKERGLKVIVVDPRRTETAQYADVFLQPFPGQDAAIAAGMIRIILSEGWEDKEFCADHVSNMDALRAAVDPFTPDMVAARAGISVEDLWAATTMFARDSSRGTAGSGTGPDMSGNSNLSEHMIEALNVVCGRYLRAGDKVDNPGVMCGRPELLAEAESPKRSFETSRQSRVGAYGEMFGEMMTGTLLDEILTPGKGQIKSLVVAGGNPAGMMPDQRKTIEALEALELLVTIEPFMVETAQYAHYVLPPTTQYERSDIPTLFYERRFYPAPFAQYSPPIAKPPAGSDVADDWYMLWSIVRRLGKQIIFDGIPLDMETAPTTDDLIELLFRNSQVPLDDVKRYPSGKTFDIPPLYVSPARPGSTGRLDVMPTDVAADVSAFAEETGDAWRHEAGEEPFTHLLTARRMREVSNGSYRDLPAIKRRFRYNPAWFHPDDLKAQNLSPEDMIEIAAAHGTIRARVEADETVKPGTITMTHGWGRVPVDDANYDDGGSAINLLVSTKEAVQSINAMPRFSGIPVRIRRLPEPENVQQ